MTTPEFNIWLNNGIQNGWVSPPVCSTHDGVPMSADEEESVFYDSDDICVFIVRLYEDQETRLKVEQNHCPTTWRRIEGGFDAPNAW